MRAWLVGVGCVVLAGVPAAYLLAHRRAVDRAPAQEPTDPAVTARNGEARRRTGPFGPWGPPSSAWAGAAPDAAAASADPAPAAAAPAQEDAGGPRLERDQQIEALRLSGPDSEGLMAATSAARDAWVTFTTGGGGNVEAAPWECHRAACFSTAIHGSMQSVEEVTSRILAADEISSWPGSKTRSAPILRSDGKVEVTWILFAPRDGGATAIP
jgi:hypothetical protein